MPKITLQLKTCQKVVSATVSNGLAVHRGVEPTGSERTKGWVVSHINTSLRVLPLKFSNKAKAMDAMYVLLMLTDWKKLKQVDKDNQEHNELFQKVMKIKDGLIKEGKV